MAALLALCAAVAFGVSDFTGGLAARSDQAIRVLTLSYPLGLVGVALVLPYFAGTPTSAGLLWGAGSGLAGALGALALYAALAAGSMSVTAPLSAVCAAVVPVMIGYAKGDRLPMIAFLGVAAALIAVALVSQEKREPGSEGATRRALTLALFSGICFGLDFVMLDFSGADSGMWPLMANRVEGLAIVACFAIASRQLAVPARSALLPAVAAGVLDVVATALYLVAVRNGMLALVAVLVALYPAATVVMARLVLAERTSLVQRLGLGLAALSIVMITAAS
jgi:uncharacterized membrane protein